MQKETWPVKVLLRNMKNVALNFGKNQKYLLRIQQTFAQDEKYIIFCWNNNLKDWKVSKSLRKVN